MMHCNLCFDRKASWKPAYAEGKSSLKELNVKNMKIEWAENVSSHSEQIQSKSEYSILAFIDMRYS